MSPTMEEEEEEDTAALKAFLSLKYVSKRFPTGFCPEFNKNTAAHWSWKWGQ